MASTLQQLNERLRSIEERMATPRNNHGDRIGALEEGYKALGREIHGLRDDLQSFATEIRRQLQSDRRTPWAPIIAAAGVVVAVVGGLITLGASGPLRELDRHEREIAIDNERERSDAYSMGRRDAEIATLRSRVQSLEARK